MSLILEALRKSEAQRRRASVPDVYAELPPATVARPPLDASRILWFALAALFLLALWIARAALAPAAPATGPLVRVAPVTEQAPSLPPVRHLAPPPSPARTAPDVASTDRPRATTQHPTAMSTQPVPTVSQPASATTTASEPIAPITTPPAIDRPSAAMSSPATTLSLSDLSVGERKALPSLKMSMHLWNEDPAQRLVIIDGNRLHEGDRIGDAVVTSIVSDGVLLDWNGRRLKLPIR